MKPLEEREAEFRKHVYLVGGTKYTKLMLDRFIEHWTQPDRAKGKAQKMGFEKEGTWQTTARLAKWARNNFDKIQCHLTEAEKSVQTKRRALAVQLEEYLPIYGREMLNLFYFFWSQPDEDGYLRWERESFWDLGTRLKQWKARKESNVVNPMLR